MNTKPLLSGQQKSMHEIAFGGANFSLSPRERAGVRGKVTLHDHQPSSKWKLLLAATLLAVALASLLTGCVSRPALVRQTFALQAPQTANVMSKGQTVLAISKFEISPLFEGRSFVYRVGPNHYKVDPYAGFLVTSSRALAIPMRSYLRNSGVFKDVVEPGSQLRADAFLEVYITDFYGDIRESTQPAAVLAMRILQFDAKNSKTNQPLMEKTYIRHVPLQQKTAAALVDGWNQALAQIMAEAASDLAGGNSR